MAFLEEWALCHEYVGRTAEVAPGVKELVLRSPSPNFAENNLLLLPSVGLGRRRREEEGENLYFKESQSGVDMDRVAVAFVDGPPGNLLPRPTGLALRRGGKGGSEWHDL